ncbi:MAG: C25 family cysteine peptidase, partial [Bacteroidales bacterium]|nr:C25 family cysteine peptidase [Bacteroidales bacterium]
MKKIYIFFVLILFISTQQVYSQTKISLQNSKDFSFELIQNKEEGFLAEQKVGNFEIVPKETERGIFNEIHTEHLMKVFTEGAPELPVVSKLIEIPLGARVKVKILSYDVEEVDLNQRGIQSKIMPAQPSESKSDDGKNRKFHFNEKIYSADDYYGDELVKVEESGIMRHVRFGRLQISPMEYNPVKNKLRIFTNIKFEVEFSDIDYAKSDEFTRKYANSYFQGLGKLAINHIPASGKELIDDSPITYVIVSDPMFEAQLQEFVEWKRLKGFHVIEAYTDDAAVGSSTTSIKNYLQDLYENPAAGVNPPSFILFVGDIQQIPSFSSSEIATHYTDLRFCEYTGDNIPEVYYGRFSAQNTSQLQPQIDKTLLYEKYLMADPSYLGDAMLVAGVDGTWAPTAGNGAINYTNGYYVNEEHGVNPLTYLYNDEANSTVMASSNSGASASILDYMNQGLGFANYTAHCSSSGWADPSFSTSNVNSLTNAEKYGLWIGNCCQSLMFGYDECFGEAGLRKADGGAIGVIGGTESTYWYEDYWWAIGLKDGDMVSDPTYEETGLGVYDAVYHDQANEVNDPTTWYIAQGQFNVVGNLAVEASSSSRKQYYWEIYHLMGDPSLVPYLRVPDAMIVSATPSTLMVGMSSLTVNAEPYAYVALSFNGELLDAQRADGTGQVTLNFEALSNVGEADLVVTCQNKQPNIGTITVSPSDQPYVVLQGYTLDDASGNNNNEADYNETISLDVTLENVSDSYEALNVHDSLYCNDPYITLTDSLESYGSI